MANLAPFDQLNWQPIFSFEEKVQQYNKPALGYIPIKPKYVQVQRYVFLIGVSSEEVKPWWWLGARVSQYLYVSPNFGEVFGAGVQAHGHKRVGLNRLTLMEFEDFGVKPYLLMIETPYWLKNVYCEMWEYVGSGNPNSFDQTLDGGFF